ncbi:T9SS type B sorting domain-containing protein [Faecalibacter macacae]|uniref:Uncharacterized protein n=1 Tax=Faecalibacter macacae TaxID=1859289 RepID=A0A3L9MJR2_9FLAO|nr:hypothetical protein EAH69_04900 [Faecalibacter macacae]
MYIYKDIPTFISPNNDRINDNWNLSYIRDLKNIVIYNRFGKVIFESSNTNQPIVWDGKLKVNLSLLHHIGILSL